MAGKDAYLDHLASVPMFSALSRKELQRLARASDEVTVEAGHELTSQGEVGREMFVLISGQATAKRNGRKIASLGPGAAFGELSLLDRGPRTATVTADVESTLLVMAAREFSGVLDDIPAITHKLLAALASRIRELDAKMYG